MVKALPNQQTDHYAPFKLVLVGEKSTGKTAFLERHLSGKPQILDDDVIIHRLVFSTNTDNIVRFKCWDSVGDGGLMDGIYMKADCAIIFFDVSENKTYNNVLSWYGEIRKLCCDIPVILFGNKVHVKNRQVEAEQMMLDRIRNLQYYEIYAKYNYNLDKPFLYLAGKLAGNNPNLRFVKSPALAPPELDINIASQQKNEADLIAAATQSLNYDDYDSGNGEPTELLAE